MPMLCIPMRFFAPGHISKYNNKTHKTWRLLSWTEAHAPTCVGTWNYRTRSMETITRRGWKNFHVSFAPGLDENFPEWREWGRQLNLCAICDYILFFVESGNLVRGLVSVLVFGFLFFFVFFLLYVCLGENPNCPKRPNVRKSILNGIQFFVVYLWIRCCLQGGKWRLKGETKEIIYGRWVQSQLGERCGWAV